jgi:hypothetical protein
MLFNLGLTKTGYTGSIYIYVKKVMVESFYKARQGFFAYKEMPEDITINEILIPRIYPFLKQCTQS